MFVLTLLTLGALNHYQAWGALAFVPLTIVGLLFTVVYFVLIERAVDRLQTLAPQGCSIYDPHLLAARAGLEGARRRRTTRRSTARRSRPSSGGCWASGSGAGSSTTAAA